MVNDVINSLETLRTGTISAGIEFKGLTKTLTSAAASTEGAGKAWTTFSRLVSGTPLWSTQNKIRAYLSILAGFETRSKANMKAQSEAAKSLLDKIKGYEKLNEVMVEINDSQYELIKGTKKLADTDQKALVFSEAYQSVFQATGDREKSMLRAIKFMKNRNSLLDEEKLQIQKTAKIQYAFDKNRIKDAVLLAKMKAKNEGKGDFRRVGAALAADIKERFAQKRDQLKAGRAVRKDAARANAKGVTDNLKSAKMLLFPLLGITKTVKLFYAGFNPFSKDAIAFRMKMRKFTMKLQPLMSMLFKYLILGMVAIVAIFIIVKFLERYFKILKEFGVIDDIKELGLMVFDFLKVGWKMVSAFINGDYTKALDYAGKFVDKGIQVLKKTGRILLEAGFLALVAGFDLLMDAVYKFYKDPDFRRKVTSIIMKVALVVVALIVVQFLIGLALSIAATFALPVLIGVAVLAALFSVAYWLNDNFDEKFQHIEDYINDFLAGIQHYFTTLYNDAINFLIKTKNDIIFGFTEFFAELKNSFSIEVRKEQLLTSIKNAGGKLIGLSVQIRDFLNPVKKIKGGYNSIKDSLKEEGVFGTIKGKFANGGTSHGGLSLVGERGPELLNLNAGSRVYSNSQSKRMVGGDTNVFNITINAKDTSDAEMRRVAEQLGKMIGNKINRRVPFGNLI